MITTHTWQGTCQTVIFPVPTALTCSHATIEAETDGATLLLFRYSDDNVSLDLAPAHPMVSLTFDDQAESVQNIAQFWRETPGGAWKFGSEGLDPACSELRNPYCGYETVGINGTWVDPVSVAATAAPAPGAETWLLLLVGCFAVLWHRHRRPTVRSGADVSMEARARPEDACPRCQ